VRYYFYLLFFFCGSFLNAQSEIYVSYMEGVPIIDGRLDEHLKSIKKNSFNFYSELDNPPTDSIGVTFRLAYNDKYLYLYIEADEDSISYHKRGYLWGDGYKVLIAKSNNGNPTPEFYELSYSPTKNSEDAWDRQRIASYNSNQRNPPLSHESKSMELAYNGISGFESLIAWSDIEPYHPAFMPEMGFGLYFAKGKYKKGVGHFPNGYSLVWDPGIFNEEILERMYVPLIFQEPSAGTPRLVAQTKRRILKKGQELPIEIFHKNREADFEMDLALRDEKDSLVFSKTMGCCSQKIEFNLPLPELPYETYTINFSTPEWEHEEKFGILPSHELRDFEIQLLKMKERFATGTINTLLFKLTQMRDNIENSPWYEYGENALHLWNEFEPEYNQLLSGTDPYEGKKGPYRRSFVSEQDATLQPYSIRLPDHYNPLQKYPLLVFLHGSGQDEQNLLKLPRSNGEFIELAPYGRDKYFTYSSASSQLDIQEAIDDVIANFSVDTDKIIIGGFSMGGYGALRTFYETPNRYAGVAIFAGHPNLANMWLDGEYPNFTLEKDALGFADKPIFIYHGTNDPALDVSAAMQLIKVMEKVGAKVTSSIVEGRGHVYQNESTNFLYHKWLNQIIN